MTDDDDCEEEPVGNGVEEEGADEVMGAAGACMKRERTETAMGR